MSGSGGRARTLKDRSKTCRVANYTTPDRRHSCYRSPTTVRAAVFGHRILLRHSPNPSVAPATRIFPIVQYVYSLIRYVPHPVGNKYATIGVIIGSDRTGEWVLHWFQSEIEDSLVESVTAIGVEIASFMEAGAANEDWLGSLFREHREELQFSPPISIASIGLRGAIDQIKKAARLT